MPVRTMTLTAGQTTTVALGFQANAIAVYHFGFVPDDVTASLGDVEPVPDADDTWRVPPGARREIPWGRSTGTEARFYSPGAAKIEVEWT